MIVPWDRGYAVSFVPSVGLFPLDSIAINSTVIYVKIQTLIFTKNQLPEERDYLMGAKLKLFWLGQVIIN